MFFVDPAFTLKQTNDFAGLIVTRITSEGIIYILEALKLKVDPHDLINEIFRIHVLYPKIVKTFIETTAAQIMLATLLRKEMIKRGKFFTIEEYVPSTREKKATRIRGLIPYYAAGAIVHRMGLNDLENELLEFPRNTHDDLIDALSQGVTVWRPPTKKHEHKIEEGSFDWWIKEKLDKPRMMRVGQGLFRDLAGSRF